MNGTGAADRVDQTGHAREPVTSTELDYLLPDKWLAANPTHAWSIDQIRRQERKKQEV